MVLDIHSSADLQTILREDMHVFYDPSHQSSSISLNIYFSGQEQFFPTAKSSKYGYCHGNGEVVGGATSQRIFSLVLLLPVFSPIYIISQIRRRQGRLRMNEINLCYDVGLPIRGYRELSPVTPIETLYDSYGFYVAFLQRRISLLIRPRINPTFE